MSYILDALRRADAERERGAVPTLHAQPAPTVPAADADADAPRSAPPWLWLALGLLLAAVLAFAWKLLADKPQDATTTRAADAAKSKPPAPSAETAAPTPPPPIPAQFPTQALSDITPAPPPRPATPPKELRPLPRAEVRTAANPEPQLADARPDMTTAVPPPAPTPGPTSPAATPSPRAAAGNGAAAASGAAEERIYAVAELPDDIRRSLPALPIGGSTYSSNPASRMLIVNGQVFREGDAITPELKLEQIRLKGAVLRFRNYRYAISF
jgi:general secretion pathway protein B